MFVSLRYDVCNNTSEALLTGCEGVSCGVPGIHNDTTDMLTPSLRPNRNDVIGVVRKVNTVPKWQLFIRCIPSIAHALTVSAVSAAKGLYVLSATGSSCLTVCTTPAALCLLHLFLAQRHEEHMTVEKRRSHRLFRAAYRMITRSIPSPSRRNCAECHDT